MRLGFVVGHGQLFIPTMKPPCLGQLWPMTRARVLFCLQSPCVFRWQEHSALGGLRWSLPVLDVSHTTPSPLLPCPFPGLWALENKLAPSVDPSLQCLGIGYTLQLSFSGAGAKQTLPQHLARLWVLCVEHFSAAVGRLTSLGLKDQATGLCLFCSSCKMGAWLAFPNLPRGLAAPSSVG